MKNIRNISNFLLLGLILLFTNRCGEDDSENSTVTDIDGNVYQTVTIGTQVWMAENLKVTKFNDGSDIEMVTRAKSANSWPTPLYCWYNNDSADKNGYGALYNYRIIHPKTVFHLEIAPKGWHVPTDEDWKTLIDYLGGESVAGGKLKSRGTGSWHSPNTGATNESGFAALPGGESSNLNGFASYGAGYIGSWWSSSYNQWGTFSYSLNSGSSAISYSTGSTFNSDFKSIRCVKD